MTRLVTLVTAAAGLMSPVGAATSGAGMAGDPAQQRRLDPSGTLALDLTRMTDATEVASPGDLPLPERAEGIGPGTRLIVTIPIDDDEIVAGCTANFVWTDGDSLFLGTAGHCVMPEDARATHGPDADWDASQVTVRACISNCSFGGVSGFLIEGTTVELGAVAYARQVREECFEDLVTGEIDCTDFEIGNDFGVIEIPQEHIDANLVRTTMPVFGGPDTTTTQAAGRAVCHYGAGALAGEVWPTMGRVGLGTFSDDVFFLFAGAVAPGDSGSSAVTCDPQLVGLRGDAGLGAITHITLLGMAGTTVDRSALMARCDADLDLALVLGDGTAAGFDAPCDDL